jgi:hypothetical protein
MEQKEIISKHNWDFVVYRIGNEEFISVVFFNSMVDFSRVFKLKDSERNLNIDQYKKLAENIRNNYPSYQNREIKDNQI